jgi:hypothetical protein
MTLVVTGILGFIENGKQVNRTNIARTIYLATQNQLTQSKVEGNLKPTLTGFYFSEEGRHGYSDVPIRANILPSNVNLKLVENEGAFPQTDINNADYVQFISKPQGYVFRDDGSQEDKLYTILDSFILDKSILNNAILVEYNIRTGVVLSVFYGDAFTGTDTMFKYEEVTTNSRTNVTGGRGMGESGYTFARERRQGYYGVDNTGVVGPSSLPDVVNIFDGSNRPLEIQKASNGIEERVNILYGEFLLPIERDAQGNVKMPSYDFQIVNARNGEVVFELSGIDLNAMSLPTNFAAAAKQSEDFGRNGQLFFYREEYIAPETIEIGRAHV